jgi:hypothetical protein
VLRKKHPNLLIVAVWHHGFSSSAGRPDRLSLADLGTIFNIGAQLGLHGHTHAAEGHHHRLLNGRLPVIGTGSLAAGRNDLPDGTPNQFCILELQSTRVVASVRRLDHQARAYGLPQETAFDMRGDRDLEMRSLSRCSVLRRVCEINAEGICRVSVEIEGLHGVGAVPLALLAQTHCGVAPDQFAECDRHRKEVHKTRLEDRRKRFFIVPDRPVKKLTWGYYISNAVALTKDELALLPSRRQEHPSIGDDEEAYSYTVRFHCEKLELGIAMEQHAPPLDAMRVLAERFAEATESTWEEDHVETARVLSKLELVERTGAQKLALLTIDGPVVGYRYSLVFKPVDLGQPYPREAASLAEWMLSECRGRPFDDSALRADLTAAIDGVLEQALGERIGEWHAHLWHASDRALLPAFGIFRSQSWSTYFEAGTGVAGHAFRHSHIVAWRRNASSSQVQTIFRKSPPLPGHTGQDYHWVLCIPLRLEKDGPSIGVVGLARGRAETQAEHKCERFVEALLSREAPAQNLTEIEGRLNIAFWATLSSATHLPDDLREYTTSRTTALVGDS